MADDKIRILPGTRFRIAIVLAIAADILQLAVMPLFIEGAESPADDVLDFGIGAVLTYLLGWQWEFLPSSEASWCPASIWFPSGHWRWRMSTARRSESRSVKGHSEKIEHRMRRHALRLFKILQPITAHRAFKQLCKSSRQFCPNQSQLKSHRAVTRDMVTKEMKLR